MFELKAIEKMHDLTWEKLSEIEPRLDSLLLEVEMARPNDPDDEYFNWEVCWGQFKSPIATLVGWHRRDECDPILRTQAAYDVAYWKLWHKLHD